MIGALITLIVYLLVIGILWWLVIYIVDAIPIPNPPNRIIKIVLMVILSIVIIVMLLNLVGVHTGVDLPRIAG